VLRFDDAARTLGLGVHDLIDAGPARGDLRLQVAWSARARMRAGQVVHTRWQDAKAADDAEFQREVTLRHLLMVRDWEVTISGRVDGLSQEGDYLVVEEVKSTTMPVERLAGTTWEDFPHWARQVQLYLHFLAAEGRAAHGRLVLISLVDGAQQVLPVPADPALGPWIHDQLDHVLHEREARIAWVARRQGAPVPFPHATWRPGQEGLTDHLTESLHEGRLILLDAPTGYGKTAAALSAALRVGAATGRRVFFATARNTQQAMAEATVRAMAARGMPVRAVSIRARERVCLNDVVACRPDACPYSEDYHDKVREGGLVEGLWTNPLPDGGCGAPAPDVVVQVAADALACPFALSMDMAAQADLIVGDINYVFDPGVRLSVVGDSPGDWIVVVDEAHNLPDRALSYGSPELFLLDVEAAVDRLGSAAAAARYRPMRELAEDLGQWLRAGLATIPANARDGEHAASLADGLDARFVRELADRFEGLALDYALIKLDAPAFPVGEPDPWMDCARAVQRVRTAVERAGEETVVLWRRGGPPPRPRQQSGQLALLGAPTVFGGSAGPDTGLKLVCRDASGLLGPLFRDLAGAVCMSATLRPADFYQRLLGLPDDRVLLVEQPSPFPPENRKVVVVPSVSTEYRRRDRDRPETARLVSEAVAAVPGNVAVFFPSFAFRDRVAPLLDLGERPVLYQERAMDTASRSEMLDTLKQAQGHVLLAVLGGIFAEGIDLPGAALLATIVVGPSLPQANLERRLLQEWFQQRYDEGFRYAWLVPGMSRVVQAAGRVVRTPEDRGAVVLIGRRFLLRDYAAFFPPDWAPVRAESPAAVLQGHWDGLPSLPY
jgi:DNA excision repair protein ERCC-2